MKQALLVMAMGWLLGCSGACAQPQAARPEAAEAGEAPAYAFDQPDAVYELPKALDEISGLTLLDAQHLGAVEDEEGNLYRIGIARGAVVDARRFRKDGDYEALERAGDRLFVLRSDGDLFEVEAWQTPEPDATRFETKLKADCDAEGLAYDAARGRLLIACKEAPGKKMKDRKAIYAFDLEAQELDETPVFLIDVGEEALDRFKPSGLALHPVSGQLYVLSSVAKTLIALTPEGHVAHIWPLPEHLFEQPEGIAFLPDGDLFISNERGRRAHATLLRFNYR